MLMTLRSLRENRNLTIKQVSEAVGISIRRLRRWEVDSFKVKLNDGLRLGQFYHISPHYIFWGKESEAFEYIQKYTLQHIKRL